MESTVTTSGRISIPPEVRQRHGLKPGTRLIWVDEGQTIRLVPAPADPLQALRGAGRGEDLVQQLLTEGQNDHDH